MTIFILNSGSGWLYEGYGVADQLLTIITFKILACTGGNA